MKKNIFYLLSVLLMTAMCAGFISCGDDDEDVKPGGDSGGGGTDSGVEGKFQGPKRVFGDNLLSSYGTESGTPTELTYNSDDFVTKIKRGSVEYKVSYSEDDKVIVSYLPPSGVLRTYTFTIGSNGFAESYSTTSKGGTVVKFEYDSDDHLTKITAKEGDNRPWIGKFTWQDGNLTKANDNDSWSYKSQIFTYNSINNVAGLFIYPKTSGDIGDFYEEAFHYIGLLGKGTKNLVQSRTTSSSTETRENVWTLDDAGRPIKCVRYSSTMYWNYR